MTNPYAPLEPEVPQGYLPPAEAYRSAVPEFTLDNDPLVNDSRIGVGGWFNKIGLVWRRSWKMLLAIFALTSLTPALVVSALVLSGLAAVTMPGINLARAGEQWLPAALGIGVVAGLAVLVVQMLGYAAATFAVTRQAAGFEVGLGEALRYGLRRCAGLTGWMLLTILLVGGAVAIIAFCGLSAMSFFGFLLVIPVVLYAFAATAMVGPAFLFERGNPITRSLHLLHGAFGQMLGRLILIGLTFLVGSVVEQALGLGMQAATSPSMIIGAAGVATVVAALIELPLTMFQFTGILVTYAERRGDEGMTTTDLVQQL